MKKFLKIFGAIIFASIIFASCSKDCHKCRRLSYYNGIVYTDVGIWLNECRKEGESQEDYKKRIEAYSDFECY